MSHHAPARAGGITDNNNPPDLGGGSSADFKAQDELSVSVGRRLLRDNDYDNRPHKIVRTGPDPGRNIFSRALGNVFDAITGRDPADHAEAIRKAANQAGMDARTLWVALEVEGGFATRVPGKQLWDELNLRLSDTPSIGVGQMGDSVFDRTIRDHPEILKNFDQHEHVDLMHDEELAITTLAFRFARSQKQVLAADRVMTYKEVQFHIANAHATGSPWEIDPGYREKFDGYWERANEWYCESEQYSCDQRHY